MRASRAQPSRMHVPRARTVYPLAEVRYKNEIPITKSGCEQRASGNQWKVADARSPPPSTVQRAATDGMRFVGRTMAFKRAVRASCGRHPSLELRHAPDALHSPHEPLCVVQSPPTPSHSSRPPLRTPLHTCVRITMRQIRAPRPGRRPCHCTSSCCSSSTLTRRGSTMSSARKRVSESSRRSIRGRCHRRPTVIVPG